MRCFRAILPFALLALAACGPAPATSGAKTPKASSKPVSTAATATPTPAASPKALAPSPAASPTAKPVPALLARPAGDVQVLTGVVRIDASYAVGAAGARLISNNGGSAVAASAAIVANNGGNLISEQGGSLISEAGGALISDAGTGLISNNGGAYGLLDLPAPRQGEVLPAAGMVLAVRDLATGELQKLGDGPQGKPVYEVLTNASGAFELYLPAASPGSLLLESRFPVATGKAADPRLQYDLVSDTPTQALVIDEDTAQVSRYARSTWKSTIEKFVLTDNVDGTVRDLSQETNPLASQINVFVTEFHAEAVRVGLNKAPAADVDALATRIADALIARVPLSQIVLSHAIWPDWTGPEEPALPALVDVMRQAREATGAKLAADPQFFAQQPFLQAINAGRATPYEVRKATDLNEILMEEYLAKNKHHSETDAVFALIGVPLTQSQRLYAAVNNYIGAVIVVLLTDDAAKAKTYELLRSYQRN